MKRRSTRKTLLRIGRPLPALLAAALSASEPMATPFATRSAPTGDTLFTALAPEQTGIVTTNAYDDPRMWAELHREYHVGAIGTGVAIGDYDDDGRPDIYIVSKIESPRLFRNLGDWRFTDVTAAAGLTDDSGHWKQGASFVDVDNDGRLDLYVCRFGAPNQLFMNRGDGTFTDEAAARGLAVVDASGAGCFADYDRDGWLDVYLQTNLLDATASPGGQRDRLFRNNGDGTFTDVTDAAGILPTRTQGHSATWWDQDEDGWPDLYVANDFAPPDFLYRNNGDGTFTNVIDDALPHTPFSSMGADLGDVDGDGRLDFYVADMAGTTWEKTQRGLADSRGRAEIDQNERNGTAIQLLYNALYLNTGTSRSLEAAHLAGLAGTDWTWSLRFEDLDNDGRIDLHVTNGMDREQNNLDMIERRLATINAAARIRVTRNSPVHTEANLAYRNRGDLRFEEVGRAWGLDQTGVSFGAAFGDLDNDGDLDLVHTNFQAGATVLRNDSQSGHTTIIALRGTTSNRFGLGARIEAVTAAGTQVRQLVSTRGYLSTSEPVAHFGFGTVDTIDRLRITWPSGRIQELTDLPTNRRYTITEPAGPESETTTASPRTPTLYTEVTAALGLAVTQREEPLEGTVNQPLLPFRFNRRGPGLAVGDLNGDGRDEVIVGATVRDGLRLLWPGPTGRYQILDTNQLGPLGVPSPVNTGPPLIFDANGDGANDLLLTAGGAALPAEEPEYEPRLWLNRGNGGLDPAPPGFLPSLPISVGAAVAADFDRDGRLDLFLGGRLLPGYYPEPAMSALLLQDDGRLRDVTAAFAPDLREAGLVTAALASDADNDGWIDLIVALEWGGVRFWRNQQGKGLADESAAWGFDSAGTGLWSSLAAGDFNEDGRLDYVIGNLGHNTVLRATRDAPLHLFVHDFAASGEPQLVLAMHEQGRLLPVASRGELGAKIPAVRRRFSSNDRYAASTLTDVLGADALARADNYTVNELRSGVLLSGAEGRFTFSPLPTRTQIAPVQGMAAADIDADGHTDLLLATNDYSSIPALGRFDSGLGCLLRGDGRGAFTAVPLAKSGFSMPGNAKALAIVDFDNEARPDVLVSRNNEPLVAFRHAQEGRDHGHHLAVRLRGRGGNPAAIGARVSLLIAGRPAQVAEVHAGGGYASQSAPTLFFGLPRELLSDATLVVRWPDGTSTTHALPTPAGHIEISQ